MKRGIPSWQHSVNKSRGEWNAELHCQHGLKLKCDFCSAWSQIRWQRGWFFSQTTNSRNGLMMRCSRLPGLRLEEWGGGVRWCQNSFLQTSGLLDPLFSVHQCSKPVTCSSTASHTRNSPSSKSASERQFWRFLLVFPLSYSLCLLRDQRG